MFWVYILENPDGKFYIGQTANLTERLKDHSPVTRRRRRRAERVVRIKPVLQLNLDLIIDINLVNSGSRPNLPR